MTGRIGAKGEIVIPKWMREQMNLRPGDEVVLSLRDDEIVIEARRPPCALGGRFGHGGMAERLLADRGPKSR